ncbi:MAG TPA: hypothetical protein VF009_07445 [Solirubrobacterales bacterium]
MRSATIKLPVLFALALLVGCGGGGGGSTSTSATSASGGATTQASSGRQPKPENSINSTPTQSREAGTAARAQAASTVKAFLDAQAKRNWGAACSYLSAPLRRGLEAASRRSSSPAPAGKGCGSIMAGFLSKMPPAVVHRTAEVHPLSLRVKGAEAILVYRDGAGTPNDMPLRREGGKWRVNFLTGLGGTR